MSSTSWRGSLAIPLTPFTEEDQIDQEILRRELRFCIESGVGGICVPLIVSEFRLLTEDERRLMIRIAVEETADTGIPVTANCAAVNIPLAVAFAQYAEDVGVDAVIAMPPYTLESDFETVFAYYQAISDAISIPIVIQNHNVMPLSTDEVVQLCTEIKHVRWVKEEVVPSTHNISELLSRENPSIKGVFSGLGGRYMITERARGSSGVMHACEFCDVVQQIWNLLDRGRQDEAEDLFERLLPALVLEEVMGTAYAKEILVRRGVLENNRVRSRIHPLDAEDMREIDRVFARIAPYFTWHKKEAKS